VIEVDAVLHHSLSAKSLDTVGYGTCFLRYAHTGDDYVDGLNMMLTLEPPPKRHSCKLTRCVLRFISLSYDTVLLFLFLVSYHEYSHRANKNLLSPLPLPSFLFSNPLLFTIPSLSIFPLLLQYLSWPLYPLPNTRKYHTLSFNVDRKLLLIRQHRNAVFVFSVALPPLQY
jgi:hypothetical protein